MASIDIASDIYCYYRYMDIDIANEDLKSVCYPYALF